MEHRDNIRTYLKFRGDLDIKNHPFNEIDSLILSELVYLRLDNIVPQLGEKGSISIEETARMYTKSTENNIPFYEDIEELLDIIAKKARYANMTLCNYINIIDWKEHMQFAAMHINITPTLSYIAFRGTDQTIVGWREDCNMSYMMPVPAQQAAVNYVNQTANKLFHKYWLGGHSKGGNLAVYSSIFCNQKIQKKIIKINSFDGPGFNRKVVNDETYLRIKDRISAFVPVSSIIGMLMEHEEDYKVVQSSESSFMQHDAFSWKVNGTEFELAENTDEFSTNISMILKSWLSKIPHSERKIFVDSVFDVFENAGFIEITDFNEMDIKKTGALIKAVSRLPQERREVVGKLIKMLIEEGIKRKRSEDK